MSAPPDYRQGSLLESIPVRHEDGKPSLRKGDWLIGPCTQAEAVDFIERTHYAGGAPNTSVARFALRRQGSFEVMGVALWLPPTKPAALSVSPEWQGVLALSRHRVEPQRVWIAA